MALLTPLPFAEAAPLLETYGLRLLELSPLVAGSVNSNFFLTAQPSTGGAQELYFARLYEEQDDRGARFEVELGERLFAARLPVARPLRTETGDAIAAFSSKPFSLYERLDGEVLCQARVTPAAARSVGKALAGVHLADLGDLEIPQGRFGFPGILQRLDRVEASGREDLGAAVRRGRELVAELSAVRRSDLPTGLTHGDLFRDNVLIRGDEVVGLLDFESACQNPYVYDLMVTILAWCYGSEFDRELVSAMLEGYVEQRPLSQHEWEALVVEGAIACLRFAATRLTDFSLRVAPGQPPLRDYGRFFARLESLRSGVLDATFRRVRDGSSSRA